MGGTLASTDSWFSQPSSQVSSHAGIGINGETHHYVEYTNRSWANGILEQGNRWPLQGMNPNHVTLTIETEDLGTAYPVTTRQFEAVLAECLRMRNQYPRSLKWLLRHTDISPASRPVCPGPRWLNSGFFTRLANELQLQTL